MAESAQPLLPEMAPEARFSTGVLPSQGIRQLIRRKAIAAAESIGEGQIQPASLDLRLDRVAYRIRSSFLPGKGCKVAEKIDRFAMHEIDLAEGAVLEKGCVYIVKLMESLSLNKETSGIGNPKSSVGRLDVFTRLITDHANEFDRVRAGYRGPLYAEISPLAFSIVVRKGAKLSQLRLKRGSPTYGDAALRRLHKELRQADDDEETLRGGLPISVETRSTSGLIGYKARKHTPLIDIDKTNYYDPLDYWEPVVSGRDDGVILNPGDFYILASKEPITVPPDHAAEMVAYDTLVGEFRVHYAGFFDPGFGHAQSGGAGTRAVLEVRSHEVPFTIEDGQIVGRLMYEKLAAVPDKLYGEGIGSSYQQQGLALSKQFKRPVRDRP